MSKDNPYDMPPWFKEFSKTHDDSMKRMEEQIKLSQEETRKKFEEIQEETRKKFKEIQSDANESSDYTVSNNDAILNLLKRLEKLEKVEKQMTMDQKAHKDSCDALHTEVRSIVEGGSELSEEKKAEIDQKISMITNGVRYLEEQLRAELEVAQGTQEELSKFEAQTIEAVNEEINKQSEVINEVKQLKLSLEKLSLEQDALKRGITNRIVDDRSKTLDKIRTYLPQILLFDDVKEEFAKGSRNRADHDTAAKSLAQPSCFIAKGTSPEQALEKLEKIQYQLTNNGIPPAKWLTLVKTHSLAERYVYDDIDQWDDFLIRLLRINFVQYAIAAEEKISNFDSDKKNMQYFFKSWIDLARHYPFVTSAVATMTQSLRDSLLASNLYPIANLMDNFKTMEEIEKFVTSSLDEIPFVYVNPRKTKSDEVEDSALVRFNAIKNKDSLRYSKFANDHRTGRDKKANGHSYSKVKRSAKYWCRECHCQSCKRLFTQFKERKKHTSPRVEHHARFRALEYRFEDGEEDLIELYDSCPTLYHKGTVEEEDESEDETVVSDYHEDYIESEDQGHDIAAELAEFRNAQTEARHYKSEQQIIDRKGNSF